MVKKLDKTYFTTNANKTAQTGGTRNTGGVQKLDRSYFDQRDTSATDKQSAASVKVPQLSQNRAKQTDAGEFTHSSGKIDTPTLGERLKNLATGAVKDYAAGMVGAAEGLLSAPSAVNYAASGIGKQNETAQKWIEIYKAQLADAKTEEERKRLENLIALNEKRLRVNDERAESASKNYAELTEKPREALQNTYQSLSEGAQADLEAGKAGLTGLGALAADVGVTGAQLLGDAAIGMLTGSGLVPMAARVYGGSTQEAKTAIDANAGAAERLEGEGRAFLYGTGSSALSVATELLGSVAAPFRKIYGGGVLDKAIDRTLARMNGSAAGKLALSFLSEGGEEVVEDLVQPVLKSLYNGQSIGENYSELELSEVLYDGLIGGILGGLGGGVEVIGDQLNTRAAKSSPAQDAEQSRQRVGGSVAPLGVSATRESETIIAPSEKKSKGELSGGKRADFSQYVTKQNAEEVSRALNDGTLAVDAGGRIYRPEAGEHIDRRTSDTVGERKINAFQFDHPEVHSYYREAAAELLEELNAAEKGGETIHVKNPGPGEDQYFRTKRLVSERIARLLDDEKIGYADIERALNAIINDEGQENFAAAKRVELMLDNMLTNGYRNTYGEEVAPNADYLAAKQAIPGAETAERASEELPIWDVADEVSRETAARRAAQVRSAAAALGQNGSRALTSVYNESMARSYAPEDAVRDFYQVYNAALNGTADSNTTAPDYLRLAARNAGERDARVASQAKYFGEKAGLVRDAGWRKAKLTSRESYALDALGKVTGMEIRFADTVENGRANAAYRDGVMTLALDAEDPVMVSAVHETVHRLRETAPEAYAALADFVQANLSEESTAFNLSKRAELYGTGDVDVLTEETVADAFGQMLEKSDVLEQFATEYRSAARKLMDALHDLVVKIKRALNGGEVRLSDNQRAAFRDLADKVGKMESLFVEALETAQGKALQGEADGATMTTMRNSLKEDRENGREEAARARTYTGGREGYGQTIDRERAGQDGRVRGELSDAAGRYGGVKPSFGAKPVRTWADGNTVEPVRGSVAYTEQQTAMEYGVPSFVVSDAVYAENKSGSPVFSAGGQIYFKETLPERNRGMFAPHEITHVMRQVGYAPYLDFVERTPSMLNMSSHITLQMLDYVAKHQHTTLEAANPTRLYDEFNAMMYGHIAAGKAEMFISGVGTGAFHDFAAYAEELAAIHEQFKQHNRKEAKFSLKTDSEGRKLTEAQEEYFKDSKVRDADGRLKVMYRGGNGTFTVFDRRKASYANLYGRGFYFTDSKAHATQYGNPRVFYLNITKPVSTDETTITRSQMRKFLKAVAENEDDYSFENYGYDATVDSVLKSTYGKSDFAMLYDVSQTAIGDMVAAVELFNEVNGTDFDGLILDTETVVFRSNQIKNTDNQNPTNDVDIRYSLKSFDDGTRFVDVQTDQTQFDGLSDAQKSKKATQIIKNKFIGKVIGLDNRVFVNGKTASEYGHPVKRLTPEIVNAKMRASTELDNLIDAGTNFRTKADGADGHLHPNAVGDFRYFDTIFKVGNEYYKGVINIEPVAKGLRLKDVTKIENITQDLYSSYGANPKSVFLRDASMDSIDSGSNNVKGKFSLKTREALDKYVEQYGEIPSGEKPHRTVRLPLRTAEDKYVSRTIRTVLEAKATPDAMVPTLEDMVADGKFSYDRYTDKQAVADAESKIKTQGWQKTLNQWKRTTKSEISKEAMATGWALYNNAATSGDVETALEVLNDMVAKSRNAAQALQAVRILKQQSPSTQLYGVQRSVENLQEELRKEYGKRAPELEIDRALAEKFLNARTDKARTEAMGEIYRDIGRQMPSRFIDKWNAWRYLAMLGNPRTHVRNIMGNAGFAPLVGVKNLVGAGLESAANAVSGGKVGRTKAVLTTKDTALVKAAWNDYANIAEQALGEGKYDEQALARKEIEAGRVIFQTKPLEKFRKLNSAALDAEDVWFSKPHYASALAQYCKANGITAGQIASGKGLEAARNYAIKEAQKATYRDTNAFSQMVSRMGRTNSGNKNSAERLGSTILEGVLPFRKTPANILVRGVEYSPIELLKSISYDLVQVKKGRMEATEMLDHLSTGLTGTGVMMLGTYMAAEGLMGMRLRGRGEGDEEERDFDELRGHQDYSLELADGTSITLDWLAPEVLPLFVGTNLWEQMQSERDGELAIADVLKAISNVSDPLLEMSCLQSLNDIFDSIGYAKSDETSALAALAANATTSYLTQALPTIFGQIERTGEDIRMTTYTDKNNKRLTSDMQYLLGKASGKLPGEYNQIPYIDAWGRTESSGSVGERAFNNFLNPAYTSTVESSATEDELERLYEATGEKSVLPDRAERYFPVDGERKDLTGEEYVKYATARGQTAYRIISELVSSSAYRALDESDKVEAVKDAYSVAKASAKMQVSSYEPDGMAAKCIEAKQKYGIDEAQYILLYQAQSEIESLKDKDGETISLSEGLLKMELIYQQKGLSDAQRTALFEAFDVPKSIRHYNKALVTEKLKAMRKKAK